MMGRMTFITITQRNLNTTKTIAMKNIMGNETGVCVRVCMCVCVCVKAGRERRERE